MARRGKPVRRERLIVLIGTRKGAWLYYGDSARRSWRVDGPHHLGHIINHVVLDPRDGRTLLAAAKTGHLGPTIFRSTDFGRSWKEAANPPAFRKAEPGSDGLAVDHNFFLAPGHPDEPDVWYVGTSPAGLFRSEDGGANWFAVRGFNDNPAFLEWTNPAAGTPDGPILTSILIDPRDPAHMYVVPSEAGTLETRDQGQSWRPLNKNVEANFRPDPFPEFGQDVHTLKVHPVMPDRLYQQNHCGIYRLDRPGERWKRIGNNMPKEVGDIGFGIVLHPRDPETAWVFPMDGTTVWPRTSPGGRPALYRTDDAGASWSRQDRGLPREQAWFTVKRQALTGDECDPVGLYFGTTGGELWTSPNEGRNWHQIAAHLPEIYSVEVATLS